MHSDELLQLIKRGCGGELTAIRCVTKLQPSEGPGGKINPPTYSGGAYAYEDRLVDGKPVKTVLLDSVQSMSNRFEEALLEAFRAGRLQMPLFEMKVGEHEVNSLTVPHRVHDAILRDSLWNGQPFRESENGKRLISARAWNAVAFFEYAPHVLLLGTWDSQGGGGVNSAKIARSLVSEIIALDVVPGVRTSSRIDPLGIRAVQNVIVKTDDGSQWRYSETPDKKATLLKPSEINHGNVTPTISNPEKHEPGGVTFRRSGADHRTFAYAIAQATLSAEGRCLVGRQGRGRTCGDRGVRAFGGNAPARGGISASLAVPTGARGGGEV